jgi:hypothetical protein
MTHFKFVSFRENLLEKVLKENRSGATLFLFPTQASKKQAIRLYQKGWDFTPSKFMTMQEAKKSLFNASMPILREDRRTIAFYRSLDTKSQEFFKCRDYGQSIKLAHNLFEFWEEMNEELITDKQILEVISGGLYSQLWQEETFQYLQRMRTNYQNLLAKLNLTDIIFVAKKENLTFETIQSFDRIVVVNQFYFTGIERYILNQIEKDIVIYSQMPEGHRSKENLSITADISARDIKDSKMQDVTIVQAKDSFSMISELFHRLSKSRISTIVDFHFPAQPYASFFSPEYFANRSQVNFSSTSIYLFFKHCYTLTSSLVISKSSLPPLIPIQTLLDAFSSKEFISYFLRDLKENEAVQQKLQAYIFELIDNDYQYIDIDGKFFELHATPQECCDVFTIVFNFIKRLLNVKAISELVSLIDAPDGIQISELLSETEEAYSDILEVFYTKLGNFADLEKVGVISDWEDLFSQAPRQNKEIAVSTGILRLFIEYMKPHRITFSTNRKDSYTITTLEDTRNLEYENIAVLNVLEGILPPARRTPFLLSENQRMELGLKTYEDIKRRDKYYLFRLLAQSTHPIIFTYTNQDKDIERSSYIEELLLDLPDKVKVHECSGASYMDIYEDFLDSTSPFLLPDEKLSEQEDFYAIPFDMEADFPDHKIILTYYNWQLLEANPFMFYLKDVMGIKPRQIEIVQDFSEKFIGTIAHEIFARIWEHLINVYQGNRIHTNFLYTGKNYVEKAFQSVVRIRKDIYYKIPHNYSKFYFNEIFAPILKDGIINFYLELHNNLQLSDKKILILPERKDSIKKEFLSLPSSLAVYLKGRADLRIETDHTKYIVDYKTGSSRDKQKYETQLLIYELLYYLLDNPRLAEKPVGVLYFITEQKMHKLIPESLSTKIDKFKQELISRLSDIEQKGYQVKETVDDTDITRNDLYETRLRNKTR